MSGSIIEPALMIGVLVSLCVLLICAAIERPLDRLIVKIAHGYWKARSRITIWWWDLCDWFWRLS